MESTYAIGFSSLNQEVAIARLPLEGRLPEWLTGTLMRTGPAKFEVGKQTYRHWFDGLAMLRKFSFHNGQVSYANRFLQSQAYREAQAKGRINRGEFATTAHHSFFERLLPMFFQRPTDNANVNVARLGDRYVSLTEVPAPIIFDPETLQTLGTLNYDDQLQGQMTTAHPHVDFHRNEVFGYVTNIARQSTYNLYSLKTGGTKRRFLGIVPAPQPAYMHSFGMTEKYPILTEFPLTADPLSFLISGKPFIENYHWQPERGTRFLVISKEDGSLVNTCETEPFFAFHHVNAFEHGNEILVDIVAFPDAAIIDNLYLERLRSATNQVTATGELRRYRIPRLHNSKPGYEVLSNEPIELPRTNYRQCNTQNYRFVYGAGNHLPHNFLDQLIKVDLQAGTSQVWRSEGCYPGEPVFVAAPDAVAEDEGVILAVVLDVQQGKSFLLVLDAQSFSELAKAVVPHHLPFEFHGQYFNDFCTG